MLNPLFKNVTFLTLKSGLVLLISLYTSRVLLQKLGVSDYGLYYLVGSVVLMFTSLRVFFSNAIQRYLNYTMGNGDQVRLNHVFNTGVQVQLFLAVIFVVLLETVGVVALLHLNLTPVQMKAVKVIFQFSVATAVVSMLTVPYDAILLAHERMDVYSILAVLEKILALGVVFLIDKGPFERLINYALLLFGVSFVVRAFNALYCRRHFSETKLTWQLDRPLIREMGVFAGWNFLGWTGYSVLHESINYMFNLAGGVAVNAGRSITYQIMSGCNMLSGSVNTAFRPQTNAAAAAADKQAFHRLLCRNARSSFLLFLMVAFPLLAFARPVVQLWLGQVPDYVIPFTLAMGGYYYLRSLHSLVDVFFLSIGQVKYYQILEMSALLLNIPVAWLMLHNGLPYWSVLASLTVFELISHISSVWLGVVKYDYPLHYFWKEVYLPFLLAGATAVVLLFLIYGRFYS